MKRKKLPYTSEQQLGVIRYMASKDHPNTVRDSELLPLVKTRADLDALSYLYPEPRRDLIADIPILLDEIGDRAVVAAVDCTHAGSWGLEPLGPEGMLIASITDVELLKGVCRLAQDVHLRNLKVMLEQGLQVVYDSWFQCGPSVGWSPNTFQEIFCPLIKEAVDLAQRLGIELDQYEFTSTTSFEPVKSSVPGIFVCGALEAPKDIPSSVIESSAAAGVAGSSLAKSRWTLTKKKEIPEEIDVTEQEPRIGVFVCNCGINIGGIVNVNAVQEYASTLPHVVFTDQNLFTCSQDTQDKIKEMIIEHKLNRLVVASCSPKTHVRCSWRL